MVGEPHPSKQGLKLSLPNEIQVLRHRRRAPSIKTRIETSPCPPQACGGQVGEPHPSKQGLKPMSVLFAADELQVGEPHPSKQGLKHVAMRQPINWPDLSASPIHQNKD